MRKVVSKDGTNIIFDKTGQGPALIIVAAALDDRSGTAKLAQFLAKRFTVINYDRRGRGQSGDTLPYAIEREVEDIERLIEAAGGNAYLFGSSSGAVLALDAASKLGEQIKGLFMYEPPFIIDNSRPPLPDDLAEQISTLVKAGCSGDAVKLFFRQAMGIPAMFVTLMRLMPGWSKMVKMAHTLPYDLAILAGTQSGNPLPERRWTNTTIPVLIMVGGKSETFFHSGAKALAERLPSAKYRTLEGRGHEAVMMAPKAIAEAVTAFFETCSDSLDEHKIS